MQVTTTLIEDLSKLARLKFDENEKEIIKNDLQRMIDFVNKLQEADTAGVEPLTHMTDNTDVYREDLAVVSLDRNEALNAAAKHTDQYFTVPKVIKQ